jgi:hypothetical protein
VAHAAVRVLRVLLALARAAARLGLQRRLLLLLEPGRDGFFRVLLLGRLVAQAAALVPLVVLVPPRRVHQQPASGAPPAPFRAIR